MLLRTTKDEVCAWNYNARKLSPVEAFLHLAHVPTKSFTVYGDRPAIEMAILSPTMEKIGKPE